MTPEYWSAATTNEKPVHDRRTPAPTSSNPDTDGDGVRDGADDKDHDDIPNMMELSRYAASAYIDWDAQGPVQRRRLARSASTARTRTPIPTASRPGTSDYGRVNPFNPCLPYRLVAHLRQRHPVIGDGARAVRRLDRLVRRCN